VCSCVKHHLIHRQTPLQHLTLLSQATSLLAALTEPPQVINIIVLLLLLLTLGSYLCIIWRDGRQAVRPSLLLLLLLLLLGGGGAGGRCRRRALQRCLLRSIGSTLPLLL
jgi:hypothetical protein